VWSNSVDLLSRRECENDRLHQSTLLGYGMTEKIMICLYVLLLEPCMKRGCCDHERGEWLCVNTDKSIYDSSSLHIATLQERKMYLFTTASAEYQTQRSCVFVLPGFPSSPQNREPCAHRSTMCTVCNQTLQPFLPLLLKSKYWTRSQSVRPLRTLTTQNNKTTIQITA
jgi:hypothetical protein